ncbi:hypothetical protein IFM89_028617 [Coptis chinensis]|uniref:RING-type domain-containing protein n=1 Tax=Coptis chinensis TaxID=261450 RepID=A0A835MA01_9MAGN|nr:hypothetical protein IFM89_028617 [Coptis chinensis]
MDSTKQHRTHICEISSIEEECQEDNPSFTCKICIEPFSSSQRFQNKSCYHNSYCKDCVAYYVETKIQEYNMAEIMCPGLDYVRFHGKLVISAPANIETDNGDDILVVNLAVEKEWRKCPGCGMVVERISGCPSIRCRQRPRFHATSAPYFSTLALTSGAASIMMENFFTVNWWKLEDETNLHLTSEQPEIRSMT